MKISDLLENDNNEWENIKPAGKLQEIAWLKKKQKALEHQEDILCTQFEDLIKANPADIFVHDKLVGHVLHSIPLEVKDQPDNFVTIKIPYQTSVQNESIIKVSVIKHRTDLINAYENIAKKLPNIIEQQDQIKKQLRIVWKQ